MVEVEQKLNNIFYKRTRIDFEKNNIQKDDMLLGKKIKIPARELLMICIDIEREFDIKVDEKDILEGYLRTYEGIRQMILDKLD